MNWRSWLSDETVAKKYVEQGKTLALVHGVLFQDFYRLEPHINNLAKWEEEYVRRGYRTIPMQDFEDASGIYGSERQIGHLVLQKRGDDEEPVSHVRQFTRRLKIEEREKEIAYHKRQIAGLQEQISSF